MIIGNSYSLITGGAGFIGTNLAHALASQGQSVVIYDNLSRPGVEANLKWLLSQHPDQITFLHGDIRDSKTVQSLVLKAEAVFHLAAQVAVTSSLIDPVFDFEVNACGTLNVLEALRSLRNPPPLIYTSTNKVLGGLERIELVETETRYVPKDELLYKRGISERYGIEFCSPYGCSKGAADQYVLDYARSFRIPAVVFRMSCIYGPHQCGNEDQGWVAHFVKQTLNHQTITFYGDGKQVRDILFVDDLIEAFLLAHKQIHRTTGQAFNLGGGSHQTVSLIELAQLLGEIQNTRPEIKRDDWRTSDQRYYVSDFSKFNEFTGWKPRTQVRDGLTQLVNWMKQNQSSFKNPSPRSPSPESLARSQVV